MSDSRGLRKFTMSHRESGNPLFTWDFKRGVLPDFSHLKPLMVEVGGVEPKGNLYRLRLFGFEAC